MEAYIGDEFLGVLFLENEKGRQSYIFELPIFDVDLGRRDRRMRQLGASGRTRSRAISLSTAVGDAAPVGEPFAREAERQVGLADAPLEQAHAGMSTPWREQRSKNARALACRRSAPRPA